MGFVFNSMDVEAKEFKVPSLVIERDVEEMRRVRGTRFKRTVLMVDDDLKSIELLSGWFESEGYEINPTFSPLHGLTMAAEQRFDVALIEINIAEIDGMEFLQELLGFKTFPVIVLTKNAEPSFIDKVIAFGASACFAKPMEMESLRSAIDKSISDYSTKR